MTATVDFGSLLYRRYGGPHWPPADSHDTIAGLLLLQDDRIGALAEIRMALVVFEQLGATDAVAKIHRKLASAP